MSRYWYRAFCRHVFDLEPAQRSRKLNELRCPAYGSTRLFPHQSVAELIVAGVSLTDALTQLVVAAGGTPPPAEGPLPWMWDVPDPHDRRAAKPDTRASVAESLTHLNNHLITAEQEGREAEAAWFREQKEELVARLAGFYFDE